MVLCFGVFAKILNTCRQDLPQEKFVSRIAWAVDRRNRSLASGLDFEVDDPEGMEGNKSVVSKLLSCKLPLVLRDKHLPSLEDARERFTSQVMPFINAEKVASAVLAILYVISQDETIETRHNENFKKYIGMSKGDVLRQEKFDVPDFLTRVLLYTTCVDNKEGNQFAKDIDDAFIEKATTESWAEAKYDVDTQTLEIIPSAMKKLWGDIEAYNDIRLSLIRNSPDYTEGLLMYSGISKSDLSLCPYEPIRFDPATKKALNNMILQYTDLVRELVQCLIKDKELQNSKITTWPIYSSKRACELYKQANDLFEKIENIRFESLISTREI